MGHGACSLMVTIMQIFYLLPLNECKRNQHCIYLWQVHSICEYNGLALHMRCKVAMFWGRIIDSTYMYTLLPLAAVRGESTLGHEQYLHVTIELPRTGDPDVDDAGREGLTHVIVVADRSGSMSGSPWKQVQCHNIHIYESAQLVTISFLI